MDRIIASVSEIDRPAIERATLDYIEGWFSGDAEPSLHPDLVKRVIFADPRGFDN